MYAVIMAGGSGTRFWPLSRSIRPKQFLNVIAEEPMLVETCQRLGPLVNDEETIIILGKNHLEEARGLFRDRKVHIIAEPVGRNTAPCVGLGAIYARYSGCSGAVAFLPADHFIASPPTFLESLKTALDVAQAGGIVTLGIVPTRPETGYGYIHRAKFAMEKFALPVYEVSSFVEKPDLKTARDYLVSGEYFWNAGIFVATPGTILKEIQTQLPQLYNGLMLLEESLGSDFFEDRLKDVYENLEPVSFDYGIMEGPQSPVYVIPCECGWSDVGSWMSLYELKGEDHDGNGNLTEGEAVLIDCNKSYVSARSGRLVACLGIKNCIVVDTDDALLIADLKRSQDIREIVVQLKKRRREDLL